MKVQGKTEEEADAGGEGVGFLRKESVSQEQRASGLSRCSSGGDEVSLCPAQLSGPMMESCPNCCSRGVESPSSQLTTGAYPSPAELLEASSCPCQEHQSIQNTALAFGEFIRT